MARAPIRRKIPTPPDGQLRDAEMITLKSSDEPPNIYELGDGSIVTLKTVVTEIWRVEGVFDQEGNPMYITKSANIATTNAPENLRRKMS